MQSFPFPGLLPEAMHAQPSSSDVSYQQQGQQPLLLALAQRTQNRFLEQFHLPGNVRKTEVKGASFYAWKESREPLHKERNQKTEYKCLCKLQESKKRLRKSCAVICRNREFIQRLLKCMKNLRKANIEKPKNSNRMKIFTRRKNKRNEGDETLGKQKQIE